MSTRDAHTGTNTGCSDGADALGDTFGGSVTQAGIFEAGA